MSYEIFKNVTRKITMQVTVIYIMFSNFRVFVLKNKPGLVEKKFPRYLIGLKFPINIPTYKRKNGQFGVIPLSKNAHTSEIP